jgi:hypothetical protein
LALLEYQLKSYKVCRVPELVSVATLALSALEVKLKVLRQSDTYCVATVLDPELNKCLPGICNQTSWDYETVYIKISFKLHTLFLDYQTS